MDVLSASQNDDKIAWYENLGGSFGAQQIITTATDAASSVFSADLDGDGDMDVLSASFSDDKIGWYENLIITSCDLPILSISTTNESCPESADASITVSTTGGPGTLTYSIDSGIPQSSNLFTSLTSGDYLITVLVDGDTTCSVSEIVTISSMDNTPPDITCPANTQVNCENINIDPSVTGMAIATDACDPTVELTYLDLIIESSCYQEITRTWTAMDSANNLSTCDQIIIVADTIAPVFDPLTPVQIFVECSIMVAIEPPTVSDNCDDDLEITLSDTVFPGGCYDFIQRDWTATDNCGNSTTYTQFIDPFDETSPVFSNLPPDITLECGEEIPNDAPEAVDNCANNVEIEYTDQEIGVGCPRVIVRTWTATDECNNVTSYIQTITITEDPCHADFDGNGIINGFDFQIFLGYFGLTCDEPPCQTDLNFDGVTNGDDFRIFQGNFGMSCD